MSSPIWMQNTSWRETGRQVKVGPLDARLMIFVVLLMLNPNMFLLLMTLASIAFFYVLEYMGYTLPNALRKISVVMSGKKKYGVHYWRQNKFR